MKVCLIFYDEDTTIENILKDVQPLLAKKVKENKPGFNTKTMFDDVFNSNFEIDPRGRVKCSVFHNAFRNDDFKNETSCANIFNYFSSKFKITKVKIMGYHHYKGIRMIERPE